MKNKECSHSRTKVVDSRSEESQTRVRRRECLKCGINYMTIECELRHFYKYKRAYEELEKRA